MNISQRLKQLPPQDRAYIIGTAEYIHDQWILFDEHDEHTTLKDYKGQTFEIWINSSWVSFLEFDEGIVFGKSTYTIKEGDQVRIQKPLSYVYQEWLNELSDDALHQFVTTINSLNYSIYDCLYCHNYLFFQVQNKPLSGVNFLVFDNEEQVCGVQHHFQRKDVSTDRFEITLNNGVRKLLTTL